MYFLFFTFIRIEWRATEIRRCLCGWNQRAPKIYRESLWWHDMLKLAIHTLVDKRIQLKIQQNLSKAAPYFPFNSREWPRQNFSILYLYNTIKTSDVNKRYQLWNYLLIRYQVLQTKIMRIVWQTVRRIINEILGVKGSHLV